MPTSLSGLYGFSPKWRRIAGWSPVVPSRYGNRYAWGHIEEAGRHLVVSGGIGNSLLPVRLGMPSEITLVELGGDAPA